MIEKVQGIDTYQVTPESRFAVADMVDPVQEATGELLGQIAERNGIEWDSFGGVGGFPGLAEKFTDKFTSSIPKCNEGPDKTCNAHIEVQVYDLDPKKVELSIECPLITETKKKDAIAAERRCLDCHASIKHAFNGFVLSTTGIVKGHEQDIRNSQKAIDSANTAIDKLLK